MGLIFAILLAGVAIAPGIALAGPMLPDLDQNPPRWAQIQSVTPAGGATEERLGFGSEVANMGLGPLLISGSRASTASEYMAASQKVANDDGSTTTYPGVGTMRFAYSETHNH